VDPAVLPRVWRGGVVSGPLVQGVGVPRARDLDPRDPLWARVALAQVAIPGDRVVGELVDRLGPGPALRIVVRGLHQPAWRDLVTGSWLDPDDVDLLFRRYPRVPSRQEVDAVQRRILEQNLILIGPDCPNWPTRLDDLGPYRPLVLFAKGRPERANHEAVLAVVGSRKPTALALTHTRQISHSAIAAGYVVVSGGARGVDWAVHSTADRLGAGQVMVVATPLDRLASWQGDLVASMVRHGLVISEAPPGKAVSGQSFLHRNRLIAALADRVVVVEAAERSGTLNTASHAKKLGRDLSAVITGPPTPENAGCHRLVEQWGADRYAISGLGGKHPPI
jgi:DNA processing protein